MTLAWCLLCGSGFVLWAMLLAGVLLREREG